MLTSNSNSWVNYIKHVLNFEGGLSKDPQDSAAKCNTAGLYHTNKGITFCTFKANAIKLGILPVTYERFLQLTEEEAAKFLYKFYQIAKGEKLPNKLAIALTEAAWGSGNSRAYKHLRDAINKLGYPVSTDTAAINKAAVLDPELLLKEYQKQRAAYLTYLTSLDKYKKYKKGWFNRLNALNDLLAEMPQSEKKKQSIFDAFFNSIIFRRY